MSPDHPRPNFGTTYSTPPTTPERLIFGAFDQCATQDGSEINTNPEEAHVGIRIPRKFAVHQTSSRYEGV